MIKSVFISVTLMACIVLIGCNTYNANHRQQTEINVRDFGAIADDTTNNTEPFRKAIAACAAEGGGVVRIPPGKYFTGPIQLKSNITLHIEKGATLRFSDNFEDYPTVETRWEGYISHGHCPLIYGCRLKNVAVTGKGLLDGQGEAWWNRKRRLNSKKIIIPEGARDKAFAKLNKSMLNDNPGISKGWATQFLRPTLIQFYECENVTIDGPTFQNSPFWTVHPVLSKNVTIRNITVINPHNSPNTDGLDIDSCVNVRVEGCTFDVGDDCIAIKSGRDEYGRSAARPSADITIRDCTCYAGHGGVVIGSEMSGDVRNVDARNCRFIGTDKGIRIKTRRGRGGIVENLHFENIEMQGIRQHAISCNMYYFTRPTTTVPPVTVETPRIRNIVIRNITCNGARYAASLRGLPEMPLENVIIENVTITAKSGFSLRDAENIKLTSIHIDPEKDTALSITDVRDLTIKKCSCPDDTKTFLKVKGKETGGIKFKQGKLSSLKQPVVVDESVRKGALTILK
jgi:Glycosyl hydrolases family 28/Pectate lyase superfamily protein